MAGETRMSTIQANAILDASGGNTTTINGVTPNTYSVRGRNIIINGAMQVAQRGTSANITAAGYHTIDRWQTVANSAMSYDVTMSQDSDAPADFQYSLKVLTNTAQTPTGGQNYSLRYTIEAQNVKHFNYGTSDAKTSTLSFWVKSNKTGTYSLQAYSFNSSGNISYLTSYTINSANTWEHKTITISANTLRSIDYTTSAGVMFDFGLACGPDDEVAAYDWTVQAAARNVTGQVNLLDTVNNYWQITGVKLEVGSVATEFDHRSYGEELALCQRYYQILANNLSDTVGASSKWSTGNNFIFIDLPVEMRTQPTLDTNLSTVTAAMRLNSMGYNATGNNLVLDGDSSPRRLRLNTTIDSGSITSGAGGWLRTNEGTIYVNVDAEL